MIGPRDVLTFQLLDIMGSEPFPAAAEHLDKHRKDAVWRTLQSGNTLLPHCVGAGKMAVMTTAGMEMKRLGLAAKPMIVVPNHPVEQWSAAFLALYPHAQLFVADRETKPEDSPTFKVKY